MSSSDLPSDPATSAATTIPRVLSLADERRGRLARRGALGLLTVFVLLGLSGVLGVRTDTTAAASGPLHVELHHAVVARHALAVPYRLTIQRDQGFDGPIEVRISTSYLASFDENGTQPQPDRASTDGTDTIWEFEPPDGDVLTVWLDTRIEPSVQWRRKGSTTVVTSDETVTIDHPLWVLP